MRIHAFLEHWGLINFNFDTNKRDYTKTSSYYLTNANTSESKFDMLVKAKQMFEGGSKDDKYFHTFASLTRRVRYS